MRASPPLASAAPSPRHPGISPGPGGPAPPAAVTISRADLRQIIAATYHQVWWPPADNVRYPDGELPEWHEASGRFLDPETGGLLPSWDDALDAIGPHGQPLHVARFGPKFDAQGVLAGSKDAGRCIRYLTKYLTKQLGTVYTGDGNAAADHADRLIQALKYEPCSPGCANWLRYGTTPKNPRPGMRPGHCRGKAHRRAYLGYAGRRILVSRRWSGKPSPTTKPTGGPGSWRCSACPMCRQPRPGGTRGIASPPATLTTCQRRPR